jgi:hypothetical protein
MTAHTGTYLRWRLYISAQFCHLEGTVCWYENVYVGTGYGINFDITTRTVEYTK